MKPYYQTSQVTLHQGDCLEVMPQLPDNSVDLILTDPPYYNVKKDEEWDRQWKSPQEFLSWLDRCAEQWQRILKPNGSLYCFASPRMAARVEVKLSDRFEVLNRITWQKPAFSTKAEMFDKDSMRGYFSASESIIFCEHQNIHKEDVYPSWIGAILRQHRRKAGLSTNDLARLFPSNTGGLTGAVRNWELGNNTPTGEQWALLQQEIQSLPDYDDVVRPFNVSADVPYTDVWTFPTVGAYPGKHPCEKPAAMIEHIINASSREGAVILDCFAGSGTTAIASKKLNRQCIAIEKDPHWCNVIRQRLGDFSWDVQRAIAISRPKAKEVKKTGQLDIFNLDKIAL